MTVIEYIDLQCPFCRQFETEAMPTILENYVRKGKAKVEARVIYIIGPDSQTGREAALAAAKQNKLFNFNQLLYDNQGTENTGWLDDDVIKSAAASIPGLDASRFESDRGSDDRQERAGHDRLAGRRGGVSVRRRRSTSCTRAASRSSSP